MAGIDDLLRQQDELFELLAQEQREDLESGAQTRAAMNTIGTKIHGINAEEARLIAQHAERQAQGLGQANQLLRQIDERNRDPYANFVDGLNTLFDPNQTRAAWRADIRDIQRNLDLDAAALEAKKAQTTQKRITLQKAIQEAELQHSFEVDETAALQIEAQKIQGLLGIERSRREIASADDAAIERLIRKTPEAELTPEFLEAQGITEEQKRQAIERRDRSRMALIHARFQIKAMRQADALDSVPDIFALSYEEAEKMGVSRRSLDEERRKERNARIALQHGELTLRAGQQREHEDAKASFLDALGPRDVHRLLEEVKADDTTNVTQVGPFIVTQEELLARMNSSDQFFAEQATDETAFALSQGQTRSNIGVWARLGGGNAPEEMTNLTGLEFLVKTDAVPEEYQPLVKLYAAAQEQFESLPEEGKAARAPAMVLRNDAFAQATQDVLQRRLATLPKAMHPGAAEFWTTGKITNSQAASDVLKETVIKRQQDTGDPVVNLMLQDLHQRVNTHEVPQTQARLLDGNEIQELQLRSVLLNDAHVSGIIDMGIHAVSHRSHAELAQQLGLKTLSADLASTDPSNVLRTNRGAVDVVALHTQLPLYLQEATKPITVADYEKAYMVLVTERLMDSLTPTGRGNIQTAALNNALFDNQPGRVIKHAVTTRLAQLDKLSRSSIEERAQIEANMKKLEENLQAFTKLRRVHEARQEEEIRLRTRHPPISSGSPFQGLSGADLMSLSGDMSEIEPDITIRY